MPIDVIEPRWIGEKIGKVGKLGFLALPFLLNTGPYPDKLVRQKENIKEGSTVCFCSCGCGFFVLCEAFRGLFGALRNTSLKPQNGNVIAYVAPLSLQENAQILRKMLEFSRRGRYIHSRGFIIRVQHQFFGVHVGVEKFFPGRCGEYLSCRVKKYVIEGRLTFLPDKAQNLCHPLARKDPVLLGRNNRRYDIGKLAYFYMALHSSSFWLSLVLLRCFWRY